MSFKVKSDDMFGGKGKPLPNGVYRATIEQADAEDLENGTQIRLRWGNIRVADGATEFELPDGTMYRIGNRKVFDRQWYEHQNEDAAAIGQRMVMLQAVALRFVELPERGSNSELEFPFSGPLAYVEAVLGKECLIRTRLRQRLDRQKKPARDEAGDPIFDAEVVEYFRP